MSGAIVNLTIDQGATWTQTLEYQDGSGSAIDLSGMSAVAQFRKRYADDDSGDPVVELDTGTNGGITLGGATGVITLTLSATVTEALKRGTYRWDLELIDGTTVTRICEGAVTVRPEVTR